MVATSSPAVSPTASWPRRRGAGSRRSARWKACGGSRRRWARAIPPTWSPTARGGHESVLEPIGAEACGRVVEEPVLRVFNPAQRVGIDADELDDRFLWHAGTEHRRQHPQGLEIVIERLILIPQTRRHPDPAQGPLVQARRPGHLLEAETPARRSATPSSSANCSRRSPWARHASAMSSAPTPRHAAKQMRRARSRSPTGNRSPSPWRSPRRCQPRTTSAVQPVAATRSSMVTSGPTCRPDTNESLALAYRRHNLRRGGEDPEAEHSVRSTQLEEHPYRAAGAVGLVVTRAYDPPAPSRSWASPRRWRGPGPAPSSW